MNETRRILATTARRTGTAEKLEAEDTVPGAAGHRALLSGVSHVIPFVVTGGVLLAVSMSLGGTPTAEGLVIPEDSFWYVVSEIGSLAFLLMLPVLSGYIASAIAGLPALAPGMIAGFIANVWELYGSEAGVGFLGAMLTGFLAGYVALGIQKIPAPRRLARIWPTIVVPVITTMVAALLFIYVLGAPIAAAFEALAGVLARLEGGSEILLGTILGAMVAFDMGGPVNKTAFLFGGGLIAAGNAAPMGMVAAATAVPPLAMGLATVVRRRYFTPQERESGFAALFMGFFGITEGAIPLAAAHPLQVVPASVLGGAVAGATAALFGVADYVMHGGPVAAVLGTVENVVGFLVAIVAGVLVAALMTLFLLGLSHRTRRDAAAADAARRAPDDVAGIAGSEQDGSTAVAASAAPTGPVAASAVPTGTSAPTGTAAPAGSTARAASPDGPPAGSSAGRDGDRAVLSYMSEQTVLLDVDGADRDGIIRRLAQLGATTGRVRDVDAVVAAALAREARGTTAVGHGIAIPHVETPAAAAPVVALARSAEGVDWSAADGDPVHLVFLVAVPQEQAGDERILTTLCRALARPRFREALLEARSRPEVVRALEDHLG